MHEQTFDHRSLLVSLSAEQRRALTETSDRAGLAHLAVHAGLIVLGGGLILDRVPFWPLLLPVQGVLVVFLFTLEHEAIHRTAFRSRSTSCRPSTPSRAGICARRRTAILAFRRAMSAD